MYGFLIKVSINGSLSSDLFTFILRKHSFINKSKRHFCAILSLQQAYIINFDDITSENQTKHNPKWPHIHDHLCRILIIGGSGSGKTNILLRLISYQLDIDKIYLYAKDPFEPKHQLLIEKREDAGITGIMEYLNTMDDTYNNTNDYNPNEKPKDLICVW